MPRLNAGRTTRAEADLAKRISQERARRGQSYEGLAEAMTKAGCSIAGSSIYKIEKGSPPRTVSVNELVTLAQIWELTIDDLLTPVELLEQRRAQEIAAQLPGAFAQFEGAVIHSLRLYSEYARLTAGAPELLEYVNNHAFAIWEKQEALATSNGVDLGDHVTEAEVAELQQKVIALWSAVVQLATKAAGPGSLSPDGQ